MSPDPGVSVRTALALSGGRLAGLVSRRAGIGAGVTIGGRVVLSLAPGAIAELAAGRGAVVVSGTNGKTTTTRLLASALAAGGQAVISHDTGANLASGLVTTLGTGDRSARPILEVDEAVLPRVLDALDPALVVLTNLSRDQLDRYGEVGQVANRWRTMLAGREQRVVANARDPLVVRAAEQSRTVWVDTGMQWREDSTACPACGALLDWTEQGFSSACGFAQPEAALRMVGDQLRGVIGGQQECVDVALALPGRWNVANAALALTAAGELGVELASAVAAMAQVREVGGRQATWTLPDGRRARLLLAKNPAGWTEVLRYLAATASGVVLVINARIADGKDPSWLWDVPFELLGSRGPRAVAAAGERHLDLAVRLRYAEVAIVLEPDPLQAAEQVSGEDVEVVATYSAFVALLRRVQGVRLS
ncbi:MAG: MurT ligase domain-containing protein [Actinomycetota bacterium]